MSSRGLNQPVYCTAFRVLLYVTTAAAAAQVLAFGNLQYNWLEDGLADILCDVVLLPGGSGYSVEMRSCRITYTMLFATVPT